MKKLLLTALLPVAFWSGMVNSALTLNADRIVYNEKDGLYYDWIEKIPCTHLNKKLEKERK